MDREVNGITEAMRFLGFQKGEIVTHSQKDKIIRNDMEIEVIPAFEYLLK